MLNKIEYLFWFGTSVMVLFGCAVAGFVAFYSSRLSRIKKEEAEFLLKASLEIEGRERRRIAADLHDSVCGDLSAIRNYLAVLEQEETTASAGALIKEIRDNVDIVLSNTKAISYNMMPPMIESSGLVAALEEYVKRLRGLTEIKIELTYSCKKLGLTESTAYELYRIIQEIFNNTLKYGQASHLYLSLQSDQSSVSINIKDDGNPFVIKEHLRSSTGMGIKNIYSRISYIGAELLQQPVEKGNHLQINIKLPHD